MTERLTYWNEDRGCWSFKCPPESAAQRLARFENIGLEPEEFVALNDMEALIRREPDDADIRSQISDALNDER